MKKTWLMHVSVAFLFALIGFYFFEKKNGNTIENQAEINNFFAQSMIDSTGRNQKISQWRGKNLIINFWATWCTPCVQEMPELSLLQIQLQTHNIQIIGIGVDSFQNISDFTTKLKISYPLYVAEKSGAELSRQFGNQAGGLPFTVLLGKDGLVKKTYLGRLKIEEVRKDLSMF